MKKLFAMLMIVGLVAAVGCGGDKKDDKKDGDKDKDKKTSMVVTDTLA